MNSSIILMNLNSSVPLHWSILIPRVIKIGWLRLTHKYSERYQPWNLWKTFASSSDQNLRHRKAKPALSSHLHRSINQSLYLNSLCKSEFFVSSAGVNCQQIWLNHVQSECGNPYVCNEYFWILMQWKVKHFLPYNLKPTNRPHYSAAVCASLQRVNEWLERVTQHKNY